jgi:hypothetical protein
MCECPRQLELQLRDLDVLGSRSAMHGRGRSQSKWACEGTNTVMRQAMLMSVSSLRFSDERIGLREFCS